MKYIFVTGGVVSSLGKGLTAGSLGACGLVASAFLTAGALAEVVRRKSFVDAAVVTPVLIASDLTTADEECSSAKPEKFQRSRPSRAADDKTGNEVHSFVIGHASHFGFRAMQIVAPKSISA